MDLRELRYGIEIETVKRTREQIAWAIHSVVGGHVRHIGAPSCYYPWEGGGPAGPQVEGGQRRLPDQCAIASKGGVGEPGADL